MRDTIVLRAINSETIIRELRRWISKHGMLKVLMTDTVVVYTAFELDGWCKKQQIEHLVIAPSQNPTGVALLLDTDGSSLKTPFH